MLPNASYFAFTATPKNKTLEVFGKLRQRATRSSIAISQLYDEAGDSRGLHPGRVAKLHTGQQLLPFGQDRRGGPRIRQEARHKKLRRYVEINHHAIRPKAEIMVDHFHEQVLAQNKIGGLARAMVVKTSSIQRAIQYFVAIREYLKERKSPWRAIVAFSGEHEFNGKNETEASLNGFPSK